MPKVDKTDLFRSVPKYPYKRLVVSLPLPPSVNHMYFNTKRGGKHLTKRAEEYIRISKALINKAIEEQRWIKQDDHTWYYIDIVFFMPDRRIRDSHNMLKILLDVMEDTVFNNDYYAMPRIQGVEYDPKNPRVVANIYAQTPNQREKGLKIAGVLGG